MLKATGTRILIEQIEASKTTSGGILLQSSSEAPQARVINVGPQVKEDIKTGDILIVDWSKVGQFSHENSKHYIVDESTVLAVVE
jgi:co-chaperonin GroES (HSP10)